jgi:hypothetical protein
MLKVFQRVSIHLITRRMRVTESVWQKTGCVKLDDLTPRVLESSQPNLSPNSGKIVKSLVPSLHDKGTEIPDHVGGG